MRRYTGPTAVTRSTGPPGVVPCDGRNGPSKTAMSPGRSSVPSRRRGKRSTTLFQRPVYGPLGEAIPRQAMKRDFAPTDRGKQVKTRNGDVVGTITGVCEGRAHVKPVATVPAGATRDLPRTDDEEIVLVDSDDVDTINNSEAFLKRSV